jgi:hypothetical protein
MAQNTSHAVMAQRVEASDSLDNFPTPPWATRALLEHVIEPAGDTKHLSCLEPACGAGHMSNVLKEYFGDVTSFDIHDYGYSGVQDFLSADLENGSVDWVITNPPFRLGEKFITKGLSISRRGVAVLVRTVFLESVGRYQRLFKDYPPSRFAPFVERVPMVKSRLNKTASTATAYAWLVWEKGELDLPRVIWIPPCRRELERNEDYIETLSSDDKFRKIRALSKSDMLFLNTL